MITYLLIRLINNAAAKKSIHYLIKIKITKLITITAITITVIFIKHNTIVAYLQHLFNKQANLTFTTSNQ